MSQQCWKNDPEKPSGQGELLAFKEKIACLTSSNDGYTHKPFILFFSNQSRDVIQQIKNCTFFLLRKLFPKISCYFISNHCVIFQPVTINIFVSWTYEVSLFYLLQSYERILYFCPSFQTK